MVCPSGVFSNAVRNGRVLQARHLRLSLHSGVDFLALWGTLAPTPRASCVYYPQAFPEEQYATPRNGSSVGRLRPAPFSTAHTPKPQRVGRTLVPAVEDNVTIPPNPQSSLPETSGASLVVHQCLLRNLMSDQEYSRALFCLRQSCLAPLPPSLHLSFRRYVLRVGDVNLDGGTLTTRFRTLGRARDAAARYVPLRLARAAQITSPSAVHSVALRSAPSLLIVPTIAQLARAEHTVASLIVF